MLDLDEQIRTNLVGEINLPAKLGAVKEGMLLILANPAAPEGEELHLWASVKDGEPYNWRFTDSQGGEEWLDPHATR